MRRAATCNAHVQAALVPVALHRVGARERQEVWANKSRFQNQILNQSPTRITCTAAPQSFRGFQGFLWWRHHLQRLPT